jgi:hypothetical protein
MGEMTKTPEQYARELISRIESFMDRPPKPRRYGDQPEMMPAVYWPVEWLVETIRAAQQDSKNETKTED